MSKPKSDKPDRSQIAITGPTPGPWVVVENDGAYVKQDDFAMLRIEERATHNEMVLALVVTDCETLKGQAKANARLISAAPDLLSACQDLILALAIQDHKPDWLIAMMKPVRDAVARAEGGETR